MGSDDQPDPQTEYGHTKRMGKNWLEKHVSNFYIIRTAWVFGNYGKNFVFTMQTLPRLTKHLQLLMTNMVVRPGPVLLQSL